MFYWNDQYVKVAAKLFGKKHPKYATSLNNMGVVYKELGKYQEALKLHQ